MNTFELNLEILRIVIKLHLHTLSYRTARISTELLEIKGPANFFSWNFNSGNGIEISIPFPDSGFDSFFSSNWFELLFLQILNPLSYNLAITLANITSGTSKVLITKQLHLGSSHRRLPAVVENLLTEGYTQSFL